jgi:hypothetical protein
MQKRTLSPVRVLGPSHEQPPFAAQAATGKAAD